MYVNQLVGDCYCQVSQKTPCLLWEKPGRLCSPRTCMSSGQTPGGCGLGRLSLLPQVCSGSHEPEPLKSSTHVRVISLGSLTWLFTRAGKKELQTSLGETTDM